MDAMRIVELSPEHAVALAAFLADFARAGEASIPAYFGKPEWSHTECVERLAQWARGEGIPAGWVPCTTRFLEDGGELLGVINLRHELTDALWQSGGHVGYSVRPSARGRGHATRMVEAIKTLARGLGLERLLVTCDDFNRASNRVVEKCGGEPFDTIDSAEGGTILRWWIPL